MFLVLGTGIQGRAVLYYLLKNTDQEIVSVDAFEDMPSDYSDDVSSKYTHHKKLVLLGQDIEFFLPEDLSSTEPIVVISCLNPSINTLIVQQCLEKGYHYLDLGGDTDITRLIQSDTEDFQKANKKKFQSIIIPDCGFAPGLVSCIAGFLNKELKYKNIEFMCGAIPRNPTFLPLSHILSRSSIGTIEQSSGISEFREDGQHSVRPARSTKRYTHIEGYGILESTNLSGTLSLTPEYLLDNSSLEYFEIKLPGHWDYLSTHILPHLDGDTVLTEMADDLSIRTQDILICKVEFWNKRSEIFRKTWIWKYDEENNIGALAQATGYTIASLALMIHEGSNLLKPGFNFMHDIPLKVLKTYIDKIPGQFTELLSSNSIIVPTEKAEEDSE